MIGAAIVSAIALVLYGWFFWKTLVLISSMVRDAINQSLSSPNISRDLSKRDNSIMKARKVGDSIANPAGEQNAEQGEADGAKGQDECGNDPIKTEVFQGFKFFQPGESRLYLYIPLMFLGKSASMQLWVVLTPSFGIYQFWGILFFEAVYLAAVVILRPFRTLRPFIWMTASSTILTLIAIVNLVLNYHGGNLDFPTREKYYGSILIWLYGGTIACAFLPGILDLGISMVYLVKKCLQKKNKVTDGKAEQTTNRLAPPSLQHIEFKKSTEKVTGLTIGTKTTNLIQSGNEIEKVKPQAKVNRISIVDNSASKKLSKMKRFTPNAGFQVLTPLKRNHGFGLGSQESNRILPINNSSRALPNLRVRDSVQIGTLPQPVSTRDFQGPLISSPRNPVRALISPKNLESQSLKVGKPKPKIFAFGQTTKLKLVSDTPSMQNLIKPSSPGRGGSDELIKESSPLKVIKPASHQNSLPESLNNTKTHSLGLQHWKSQKE